MCRSHQQCPCCEDTLARAGMPHSVAAILNWTGDKESRAVCTQATTDLGDSDIISDPGKLSVVQGKGRTEGRKGREEAAEVKSSDCFCRGPSLVCLHSHLHWQAQAHMKTHM